MNNKIYSETGRLMMGYGKYFKTYMKKALAPYGLNVAETMVLMLLYEKNGQTQDQLLEGLHYDKSVMARTMQSLETNGMLLRHKNPDDGRSWIFVLTDKSTALKPSVLAALKGWCAAAFDGISEEEMLQMLKLLRQVQQNIEE